MKINSLSSLQAHTAQKTMFSNGNARFSKADNQDVKSMLAQAIPSHPIGDSPQGFRKL